MRKVVLVYSGGLDTSVCIPLMREEYGFEHVITVTVDVGQAREDIAQAPANDANAVGERIFGAGADYARNNQLMSTPIAFHNAETGALTPAINPKYSHSVSSKNQLTRSLLLQVRYRRSRNWRRLSGRHHVLQALRAA